MEIGVSPQALEHTTVVVDRNLTGFVRTASLTVGTTKYCYFFGGSVNPSAGWFERCTLYTDSKWYGIRSDSDLARTLSARADIDALTSENAKLFAKRVA